MRVSVGRLSPARRSILMGAAVSLLALCTSGASFNCAEAELVRLDPASGDQADSVELGDPTTIGHLAIGDGKVWLAACGLSSIARSGRSGRGHGGRRPCRGTGGRLRRERERRQRNPVRPGPAHDPEGAAALGGPRVLDSCDGDHGGAGRVVGLGRARPHSVRPRSSEPRLERRLRLPDRPRDIAIAGESVWVATDRGRLVSVDPRSAETIRSVDLDSGSLSHVAAGAGAIWATSYDDDAVFRVGATDLQPTEPRGPPACGGRGQR